MKLTYGEILDAKPALENLAQKELKMSEAIALARLIKTLNNELEVFFDKQKELCDKYGTVDEKNGNFTPYEKNKEFFLHKHKELLCTEFEADISKVEICSDIDIEAATILTTDKLITWGGVTKIDA